MIFVEQVIRTLLKEEGPKDKQTLVREVADQMNISELDSYIEATLDNMIGTGKIDLDENGKVHI